MKPLVSWAIVALATLAGSLDARASGKIRVLSSFLPLYCFAANVAGSAAQVDNLLPAGAGPHDYQLSVRDRERINSADVVILNGLGIDGWIESLLRNSKTKATIVSMGISNQLIRTKHSGNPHIWLDPDLAMHCVSNIAHAFVAADPANEGEYLRNTSNYVARLQTLDEELRLGLAPYQGAKIVTFHDSFRYFARRYGLVIAGVIEEIPDVSPSARDLSRLYKVVRETKPKAIFTEPQFSPRLANQIGADLKVLVAALNTLETGPLNPDAYEQIMRENLRVLQEALK